MLFALYPMLMPASHSYSALRNISSSQPGSALSPARPVARRGRKRPRGIWKTRRPAAAQAFTDHLTSRCHQSPESSEIEDQGDVYDDFDAVSDSTESSSKRRRPNATSPLGSDDVHTSSSLSSFDFSSASSASVVSSPVTSLDEVPETKPLMESLLADAELRAGRRECSYADWEQLKSLFAEAAERYERDETIAAAKLLRATLQECNRFMSICPDLSSLFSPGAYRSGRSSTTKKGKRPSQDDYFSYDYASSSKHVPIELPTAFHAILGIALFLFGNLIDQDVNLAQSDEPNISCIYWLAALDIFETAENLPNQANDVPSTEDWRMAVVWGRTLVCLADTKSNLLRSDPSARLPVEEPKWPPNSIFRAIATVRPPVTRRRSLATASPNDLLVLAMDQFSRGILHMPHPHYNHDAPTAAVAALSSSAAVAPRILPQTLTPSTHASLKFSRHKELFTIASEVLAVAERLRVLSERRYWALWADAVFEQMKMEAADVGFWRGRVAELRGKCWLVAASVQVDDIEDALERGEAGILNGKDAVEARGGYQKAIAFFERARACEFSGADAQPMFVEALLSLANLILDKKQREELYARAEAEGAVLAPTDDAMDES